MRLRSFILRLLMAVGLIAAGLTLAPAANATGGGDPEPCVPKDAWTETIEHPEVTEVVHHDAVVHTEYRYAKFTHTKTRAPDGDWSAYGAWTVWGNGHEHESWQTTNVEALGAPAFHGSGVTNGTEFYREWQVRNTGETRQVEDKAAYDETVVVTEAWTETIEHPAVICPPVDEYPDVEVCALWSVDNPAVADFPQTRVDSDDCSTPPATCEGDQRFQRDYYWIRDAEDEAYLAGLDHLTSPADDARLEPHGYSMIDVPATPAEDCATPKTEVTPTAPTGTPDDCDPDAFGTITIPSQDGVVYMVNGVVTPSGTIPANGTNTVTAEAASNDVVLVGTTSWEFTSNPETDCPVPPVDVCPNVPGDQAEVPAGSVYDEETGECVLVTPEEPVLPPSKPEKPTKPAKPSAAPPTTLLTQAPVQPAQPVQQVQAAQPAQAVLPATGAPASLWLVLLGAGLLMGGVVMTRRSNA